jgi:hypothetical protein
MGLMSGLSEKKFAGAAEKDSVEAYSAIVQHQYGDQNKSLEERLREAVAEQTAILKDQARIGQETLDYFMRNPVVVVDI